MIGQTFGRYRVLAKLGEGGMGVVYKAEDTQLDRIVALKFLAQHLVSNEDVRKRFIREAKTAAALSHPNICTIYEIGEASGRTFIAMAYLEGRELSDVIADGPMDAEKAVELAGHFADGLAEAHAKGVVHRDIKPANLFVTSSGRGVVVDFGLALLASANSKLTREGTIVGTCAYMSPEQATGTEVDARTDVWALGCVLYEMLAGEAAFQGHYEQAVIYSVLNEQPPLLDGASTEIREIVSRCLEKDKDRRYDDGAALYDALRGLKPASTPSGSRTAAPADDAPRVAVLPFKTRSGDGELESFAEGLTEEITTGLAQFRHLSVISSTAVGQVQNSGERQEARRHGARFVVEGSIRKAGSRIRVNTQLVDVSSGAHLWAERFDRDLSSADIFEAQDELTDRIVATVADPYGVLTRALIVQVKARPVDALTAHECVLLMYGYLQQIRPELHAETRAVLEAVLEREPDHAEAQACLAILYLEEYYSRYNPLRDPLGRGLRAAQRAVELDGTSQLAYRALATAHYFRRELGAFRIAADRVLEINPRDTDNIGMIGVLIAESGDWEAGLAALRNAMQMNPHHAGWLHTSFIWDHYRKGEYEQALEAAERVNMPGFFWAHLGLAAANAQLGKIEFAHDHLKRFVEAAPDFARDARAELTKWFAPELVEHILEGLTKAGLDAETPDG